MKAGADAVLPKPLKIDVFVDTLLHKCRLKLGQDEEKIEERRKFRFLIVDDSLPNRKMIRRVIESQTKVLQFDTTIDEADDGSSVTNHNP